MTSRPSCLTLNQMDWKIPEGFSVKPVPDLTDENVICGPDGCPDEVTIIEGGGRSFSEMLKDLCHLANIPPGKKGALPQHVGSAIEAWTDLQLGGNSPMLVSDYGFHRIVAFDADIIGEQGLNVLTETSSGTFRINGLFLGEKLAVEPTMKGIGLGKGLVAAHLAHFGNLPTWGGADAVVNHAGIATAMSGLRLARKLSPAPTPDHAPTPNM